MRINKSMKKLLQQLAIESVDKIPPDYSYPIWEMKDSAGRPYWGSSHWNLDHASVDGDCDLSRLEWDGNELYLDAKSEQHIPEILEKAIGILSGWKAELQSDYPNTHFVLFASYDDGEEQILDESEKPVQSVTLRFWADRGSNTVVNLSCFDEWEQPAFVDSCND